MSAQDAEGIRKHVSKLRFSRHARTLYEESVKTRASIDRLTAAIVAAASEAENRAEDASNERHEHAVTVKGLLERILSELLAVRSLPPAAIDGSSGTPVASSPATLGGVGSSSSSSSSSDLAPALSADTVAHSEGLPTKWEDRSRRAHWILTGAPPIGLKGSTMQDILGGTTLITRKVKAMLTTLTNFDVRRFLTPTTNPSNALGLKKHTKIMCEAIVSLAAESIPASGGALENTERTLCQARVQELAKALKAGSDLVVAARRRNRMDRNEFNTRTSSAINADMATWTQALHAQAGLLKDTLPGPPESECNLESLCLPTWPKLKALVSSQLEKHKKGLATPKDSRKHKSPPSKRGKPGAKTATPEPKQKKAKRKAKAAVKQEAQQTSAG